MSRYYQESIENGWLSGQNSLWVASHNQLYKKKVRSSIVTYLGNKYRNLQDWVSIQVVN